MKRWTMSLLVACAGSAAWASVEISVTGAPPLPARNLLASENPSFEDGFAKWGCKLEEHRKNGLIVELSAIAPCGTNALYVDTRNALPSLNLGWGGGSFSAYKSLPPPEKLFEDGRPYVLSCLAQSEDTGSGYSGVSLGHYLEGWKAVPWGERVEAVAVVRGPTQGKWRRFTSEPFTYRKGAAPTFFTLSVGVVYERNALRFDEIGIYPAFSELSINVKGRDLLQVAVQDEQGAIVYSSKLFAEPDVDFSATVRVSAVGRYRIKTVDKQGDVVVRDYPDIPPAQTGFPGLTRPHPKRSGYQNPRIL